MPLSDHRKRALALDAADRLAPLRSEFLLPPGKRYLCGHSLGAQPRWAREIVLAELDSWAAEGVEGHFKEDGPWYTYHELVRDPLARLVGARADEVVAMNGLTVNLHLLLASFFRPAGKRTRILIDEPTFPSDRYAVLTHLAHRGLGPEHLLASAIGDIERTLEQRGEEIAVALLAGVNFLTGEVLDIARLTRATHRQGCLLGLDLAHAAGNVPLRLHDDEADFAVWCSYKYLNSGPGAVAGAFVHQRHGKASTPRLGGWWGNDPATRFRMQLETDFVPRPGADGWQLSNPPIFSLAPLRASLELFDRATMPALRAKSLSLIGFLLEMLAELPGQVEVVSPREAERRGNMVCLRVTEPRQTQKSLESAGVVCDFREPDIIRASACPLYNTHEDVWAFAQALAGPKAT
jgi:kynureninase